MVPARDLGDALGAQPPNRESLTGLYDREPKVPLTEGLREDHPALLGFIAEVTGEGYGLEVRYSSGHVS